MTHIRTETMAKGAKAQSIMQYNPRDLLERLIAENPAANEEQLLDLLKARLTSSDGEMYLPAIILYWMKNNLTALRINYAEQYAVRTNRRQERAQVIETRRQEVKQKIVQMVLLDLQLPDGIILREATAAQCRKAGGFFARVADKVPGRKKVGEVLSEAEVRKLYNR